MEECLNTKSIVLREAFTDLLGGNVGRLQELLDKVEEKKPSEGIKITLKAIRVCSS